MRLIVSICCGLLLPALAPAQALPGTKLLETKDDLARVMVDGIHRYLDKQTELAAKERPKFWKADFSTPAAFDKSVKSADAKPLTDALADYRAAGQKLINDTVFGGLVYGVQQYLVHPYVRGVGGNALYDFYWSSARILKR